MSKLAYVCLLTFTVPAAGQLPLAPDANESSWAFRSNDTGRLVYGYDAIGRRLADFSNVGYRGGNAPLPIASDFAPSRIVTLTAQTSGDDTARIQAAIDQVGGFNIEADGFRGVVQLGSGDFRINSRLNLNDSGVIFRGAGSQQTTLRSVGTGISNDAIRIKGGATQQLGSSRTIIDKYVPHGTASLRVNNVADFNVGDTVRVRRDYNTQNGTFGQWVQDLGMDRLGDPGVTDDSPGVDQPWGDSEEVRDMTRRVVAVDGDRLFFDAPLTTEIAAKYGGGTVKRLDTSANVRNVGVENIRYVGDFDTSTSRRNPTQEAYTRTFVRIDDAEDVFVRDVDTRNLSYAHTHVVNGARQVTVEGGSQEDWLGPITGGRRYTYQLDGELGIVKDSESKDGRHDFATSSRSVGPNVFFNSTAEGTYNASGPHQRWNLGALFDNITITANDEQIDGPQNGELEARNRGPFGTGHGYSGAYQVAWNSKTNRIAFETPVNQNDLNGEPVARNWIIGHDTFAANGIYDRNSSEDFLNAPIGDVDSPYQRVSLGSTSTNPTNSLYLAQLEQRLSQPTAQNREYWLGDFDRFESLAGDEDGIAASAAWLATASSFVASDPNANGLKGFDDSTADMAIPLTFDFAVNDSESVTAAVLTLAFRRTESGRVYNDSIFIERLSNELSFEDDFGFTQNLVVSNEVSTVLSFEFLPGTVGFGLDDLQDGQLNLLLSEDIDLDWANLIVTVAPTSSVPEPASLGMLGVVGLMICRRRR